MNMTKAEVRKHIEVLMCMAAASGAIGRDDWDDSLQAAAKFMQDAVEAEPVAWQEKFLIPEARKDAVGVVLHTKDPRKSGVTPLFTSQLDDE